MKRILINAVMLFLLLGAFSSCKKTLDSQYNNPNLPTTGSVPNLFTGMQLNNRIHSSYWDYYTFNMSITAPFSQMVAIAPDVSMYTPSDDYITSRWNDYYDGSISSTSGTPDYRYSGPGIMSTFREMQSVYATLPSDQQENQKVFLQAANVIVCDQTAQMVDLFGDIPFSEANSLNISRTSVNASFDNAAALYDTLINTLDAVNTYFSTANLSSSALSSFKTQDLIYGGSIDNWRRYANSLRLRLLMRISNVNPSEAQAKATAMLKSPDTYPLITDNSQNAVLNQSPNTLISDIEGSVGGGGPHSLAPSYMLDTVMQANGDPRLSVFWDINAAGKYVGISAFASASAYSTAASNHTVSPYDTVTFVKNYNVPGVLFTAAETNFLVAEADVLWGLGDGGSSEYYEGISQSIKFYYGINQSAQLSSGSWPSQVTPSDASIKAFEAKPAIAFASGKTDQLAQIYTQKWLNFFIVQSQQAWAEYRRTGYPKLNFYNFTAATGGKNALPPNRLKYPQEEQQYNGTNYQAVASKDTWMDKIFWDVNK